MSEPGSGTQQRSLVRRYFDFPLIWKMLAALVAGAIVGLIVGPPIAVIEPLGTLFLNLLQMVVVPLVVFTLVVGVSSVALSRLGRIGVKIIVFYLATSAVAIILGIALALAVGPGSGLAMPDDAEEPEPAPEVVEVLLDIVPENPVQAMAEGNMLAVVFFALVIGLALAVLMERPDQRLQGLAEHVRRFFDGGAEVMFVVIRGVLEYGVIGVFALIAVTLGETGAEAIGSLAALTAVVYGGVGIQLLLYAGLLAAFGISIGRFFRLSREAMVTAYVSRSSNGTLPVSMRAAERMGIDEGVYGFSLPLGATVNMDGTALYVGASVVFVAQVAGVNLSVADLAGVVLVGVLASIGTAGVPGAGLIMLSLAITQAGLPFAPVALVAGIDALLDMIRTMCNITGDLTGTRIVAKTEGMVTDPEEARSGTAQADGG